MFHSHTVSPLITSFRNDIDDEKKLILGQGHCLRGDSKIKICKVYDNHTNVWQ